ncbi:pyrimidine-nucleoside phosphorylase [Paenibacillus sp. SYP-B3998]|uniref:Pyrimidine-nucleoside phosphorylase n=1 Tax=Paenibacillus sp. SYP-B3998 TaxID=2678564 RepID=A0A6G4A209_9BACL|nr:pyrimidine-nucleoside phosphorylase [Paenibacillus sp. SYP-B3998]NEW08526.1 pyrimidine-nucleoside phosphorylase [Paenibacillus sp. SYP-B3998]
MRMVDLIAKKRDGGILSKQEIDFIIKGYTKSDIPDYQLSAWAMAIYFKGMTSEEVAHLTMAMTLSGDMVNLSEIEGVKVDKHSTGGVGDTTTIILAPLVAAAGIPVAKMSGRGLGHTGGTIDKLESIPGFHVELTPEEFIHNVNEFKIAVIGQSGNLTPADKKLYGLRDVTATVDSIPLIASSIMSKKIAAGADAIVLDVKTGAGAFMKSLDDAKALASAMVDIGRELGRHTVAIISDMSQPLGYAVGNSLEIREAIDTLRGQGPEDLTRLVLTLGAHMVVLGGKADTYDQAYSLLEELIRSGKALEVLKQFVAAQGGTTDVIDDPDKLPKAPYQVSVTAPVDGYIHAIQAEEIGIAAMLLGAGRPTKESSIDLAVGVMLTKKVGQAVRQGETIAILHANQENVSAIAAKIEQAFSIQNEACEEPVLIYDIIH